MRKPIVAALLAPGLAALTASCVAPPAPGRLMLSNFSFDSATVQTALAAGPDCAIGDPRAAGVFVLPPNGTRVIPAPPGFDVCWRRGPVAGEATAGRPTAEWTEWSRAYTGSGRFLDAVVEVPPPPRVVAAVPQTPVSTEATTPQLPPK